jgi:hypothetical protein
MPEAVPRAPRRDTTAADAGSLERMGRIDEQPVPTQWNGLFLEPQLPPEEPAAE